MLAANETGGADASGGSMAVALGSVVAGAAAPTADDESVSDSTWSCARAAVASNKVAPSATSHDGQRRLAAVGRCGMGWLLKVNCLGRRMAKLPTGNGSRGSLRSS